MLHVTCYLSLSASIVRSTVPSNRSHTGSRLLQSVLEAAQRVNTAAAVAAAAAAAAAAALPSQDQQGAAGDGDNNVDNAAAAPVAEVYLHVQTSNADALSFYKKFAFENRGIIRNYYKRIEPPDCYMLALPLLKGMEHLQQPQPAAGVSAPAPGALVASINCARISGFVA